jgi:hypothetical protein
MKRQSKQVQPREAKNGRSSWPAATAPASNLLPAISPATSGPNSFARCWAVERSSKKLDTVRPWSSRRSALSLSSTAPRKIFTTGFNQKPTELAVQPGNRGTAPAILYTPAHRGAGPRAIVAFFPSDHYI